MSRCCRACAFGARAWLLAAAAAGCLSCAKQGPVLRYPWFEDYTLELSSELLVLDAKPDRVQVAARFDFRELAEPRDRVLTFPIAPPCSTALGFSATLARPGREPLRLPVWRAKPGVLPAGAAVETYEIAVRGSELQAHAGRLLVRYEQRCADSFRYTLKTGAYWSGPIGTLDVVLLDSSRMVSQARVEGVPPTEQSGATYRWLMRDLEPDSGVELALRPGRVAHAEPTRPPSDGAEPLDAAP